MKLLYAYDVSDLTGVCVLNYSAPCSESTLFTFCQEPFQELMSLLLASPRAPDDPPHARYEVSPSHLLWRLVFKVRSKFLWLL